MAYYTAINFDGYGEHFIALFKNAVMLDNNQKYGKKRERRKTK
jgi:hypothetical protein